MIRFAITDRTLHPGNEKAQQAALIAQTARLSASGVDFLQVREKDLSADELVTLVRQIVQAARENQQPPVISTEGKQNSVISIATKPNSVISTEAKPPSVISTEAKRSGETCFSSPMRILVNGNFKIALQAGADGVHLTATQLYEEQTAALITSHKGLFLSASCHTIEDIHRAKKLNVETLLFGPVFGKNVRGKDIQPGIGLEALRQAVRAAEQTPVIALGRVTNENAQACIDAGAAGIAGIRMFL